MRVKSVICSVGRSATCTATSWASNRGQSKTVFLSRQAFVPGI